MHRKRKTYEGIEVREWKRVTTYRASVWSPADRRLIKKSFPSLAEARSWRTDALARLAHPSSSTPTLETP